MADLLASTATRHCPRCGKRLARLNRGPECFSCQQVHPEPSEPRRRRTRLPHEDILRHYRECGSAREVARRLGLPRSSVWHAVKRAEEQGHLGSRDATRA